VEAAHRTNKIIGSEVGNGDGDKCLSSEPLTTEEKEGAGDGSSKSIDIPTGEAKVIMGHCEACHNPWDMYRGKRRCPTCGVPSLICRECLEADQAGTKKLGKEVRCDLCVAEQIRNKRELREREQKEKKEYEQKQAIKRKPKPNPERITRLFLKNMCARQMDETRLLDFLRPAKVTYIQWLKDRNTGKFYGSAFIEVATAGDAGLVLALDGMMVLGRKFKVKYQKADEKDVWPLPNTEVSIF